MIEEAPKATLTYQETKKTINYSPGTCQDTVGSWNGVVSVQGGHMVQCAQCSIVLFIIFSICFLFKTSFSVHYKRTSKYSQEGKESPPFSSIQTVPLNARD
jgi:hypothetical protein